MRFILIGENALIYHGGESLAKILLAIAIARYEMTDESAPIMLPEQARQYIDNGNLRMDFHDGRSCLLSVTTEAIEGGLFLEFMTFGIDLRDLMERACVILKIELHGLPDEVEEIRARDIVHVEFVPDERFGESVSAPRG